MIIDCDGCAVRGTGCADCVVTALLGPEVAGPTGPTGPTVTFLPGESSGAAAGGRQAPGGLVELDEEEQRALAVLARAGLVAPLRLAAPEGQPPPGRTGHRASGDTPTRRRAV